jgi:hypothetical protein
LPQFTGCAIGAGIDQDDQTDAAYIFGQFGQELVAGDDADGGVSKSKGLDGVVTQAVVFAERVAAGEEEDGAINVCGPLALGRGSFGDGDRGRLSRCAGLVRIVAVHRVPHRRGQED